MTRGIVTTIIAIAVWAIAAPFLDAVIGLEVSVARRVEIVDHVAPGLLVLAAVAVGAVHPPAARAAVVVTALAALWMSATHVPLIVQAVGRSSRSLAAAAWHLAPGLCLLVATAVAWGGRAERPDGRSLP